MTISLFFPPALFSQGRHFPRQLTGKLGKHLHQCSWKSSKMQQKEQPQVPGVWSKNIFGDTTFRTSCCKSSVSGSGWAAWKTHLWSSVSRLGMPQADQTGFWSLVETSQHLQKVVPLCSGAQRIYDNVLPVWHGATLLVFPSIHSFSPFFRLLLFFKHRFMPDGFHLKFSTSF